jgi:polar amino acid transport system substrate-binding protein
MRRAHAAWVLSIVLAASRPADATTSTAGKPLRWAADAEGGAPYIYKDPKDPRKHIGFEVDLASALSRAIGRPIVFQQYDYKSLLSGLLRGDFDLAMNGLEVTADRLRQVRFTRPYYIYQLQLVVRAGERRFRDLDGAKAAGVIVGTLEETAAQRLLDARGIKKRAYEGQVEPYNELANGRIDAVLLDLPIAETYARPNAKLEFAGAPFGSGTYAIALRPNDARLAALLDEGLRALWRSGELESIYKTWRIWTDHQRHLGEALATNAASHADGGASNLPPPATAGALDGDPKNVQGEWTFARYFPLLLEGAWVTIVLSVLSMLLAMALGLLVATLRLYAPAPLSWIAVGYIEFFRGIPVLLLLFFLYYGLPEIAIAYDLPVGLKLGPMEAAVLGFGLNYAAYEAEVYRAAILSVPRGQWEAAASLGMSRRTTFLHIVLPQSVRFALPPMTNDFVALFKDTSVVSILAVVELSKQYQILAKSSGRYLEVAIVTALLYLVMSVPLGYVSRRLEARWSHA